MKQLSNRMNFGLGVLAAVCATGVLACSSSEETPTNNTQNPVTCTNKTDLTIFFSSMYSAFDGNAHTFQIPAIVDGVSNANVTWSASNLDLVNLDPRPELLMITTKGVGQVQIEAQIQTPQGPKCGSAPLTITQATPEEWAAGNTRYNNNVPLPPIPMPPIPPADGSNLLEAGGARPACTNCHGEASTGGIFNGVTHTPQQIGGFTDDDLLKVMQNGVIPPGGYFNTGIGINQMIWSFFHKWTLSPQEARGLVVYLRALTPKSAGGSVDFTNIRPGGGSGGRGGAGGTGGAAGTGGAGGTGTGGAGGTSGSAGTDGGT